MSDWLKNMANQTQPSPARRFVDGVIRTREEQEPTPAPSQAQEQQPEPEKTRDPTRKEHEFRPPEPDPRNQPTQQIGPQPGGGFGNSRARFTQAQLEHQAQQRAEREAAALAAETAERQRLRNVDPLDEARRRIAEKERTQEPRQVLNKGRKLQPPGTGDGGGRKL